jgi:SPP1 gp7 family putative phage head morphogenesis protein
LKEANVELEADYQAVEFDEYGKAKLDQEERENTRDWTPFTEELESLGIPRSEMPQISGAARGALIRFLEARGIGRIEEKIQAHLLRPAQIGYWPGKVAAAQDHVGPDRAVLISRDGYILDGHHQWFARLSENPNAAIPVWRFSAGIKHLLPIARTLPSAERQNADSPALQAALASGKVWYADGAFGTDGSFGSDVSRELRALGAHYDASRKVFVLAATEFPIALRSLLSQAQARAEAVHQGMIGTLRVMEENIDTAPIGLNLARPVERIVLDLTAQFNNSVKGIEAITVAPELAPPVRKALTETLTNNLELAIRNFSQKEIPELRKMVEANLMSGARLDRLSEMIEELYGVTQRKADFLASQETALLTSKFRMERAKSVGSTKYIWHTRQDERVRPGHRTLDGVVCFWDQPPLDDPARGGHHNPGEAYGCRCWGSPIIELPNAEEAA